MPRISVEGTSLYYEEAGTGDSLVLVHGTGASAYVWEQTLPMLSQDFRTIAYDRRGHQRSAGTAPPVENHYAQHGQDLLALLEGLNTVPATVLGWSAGCFAVLHAALTKPDYIKRLVLYEPPFHAKKNITWPLFKTFARVGINQALRRPERGADAFRRMVMAYTNGRNTLDGLTAQSREIMQRDTTALLAELGAGTGEELSPALLTAQIKIPVSLMVGELSPPLFTSAVERLRRVFPQAPVFVIPRANHFAQIDAAEMFAKVALSACKGP